MTVSGRHLTTAGAAVTGPQSGAGPVRQAAQCAQAANPLQPRQLPSHLLPIIQDALVDLLERTMVDVQDNDAGALHG